MNIDKFGFVSVEPEELFEALYSGRIPSFENLFIKKEIADQFNKSIFLNKDDFKKFKELTIPDISVEEFDLEKQTQWFMPDEYKKMDIEEHLVHLCPEQNYQRLIDELKEFKSRNMIDLLRYLKYLVDTMRKNNIVWGVGRGSSVASYCLYLLGVHKIDSVKYDLDIKEFLK